MPNADRIIRALAADDSTWDSLTVETEEITAIFEENGQDEWTAFRAAVREVQSRFDDAE